MMPNPITAASESITVNEMGDRYRSLLEDTSDGFYSFDADSSRFVFMNGRSLDFLGYSDKEVKKLRAWEIIVPGERHLFKKRLRTLLKGKMLKPERCVYTALRKDLTTLNVEGGGDLQRKTVCPRRIA